jgi:hypothetical protein
LVVDGAGRRVTGSGTRGWRTAVTGGVLVWAAVKAAMAVLAVLVPGVRGKGRDVASGVTGGEDVRVAVLGRR